MTIITDQSEFIISLGESLSNPKGTLFKTKDKLIKFGLFKGKYYLGMGEFIINNDVRWVSINNNSPKKQHDKEIISLSESLRIRIKCSSTNESTQKKIVNQHHKTHFHHNAHCSEEKMMKKSTPLFDTKAFASDKSHQHSISQINQDNSYLKTYYVKSKTGRISQNRAKNCNSVLNTDIYSSYNALNSTKANTLKRNICNNVKRSYHDLRSLSAFPAGSKTEYRTHLTQKHFKRIHLSESENHSGVNPQAIDKSIENYPKKNETPNEVISLAPIEEYECSFDSFITLKDDFYILYEDGYLAQVPIDTIRLESEVFVEKVSEMQVKYHQIMKEMNKDWSYYNNRAKELNDLLIKVTKKRNKLKLLSMESDYQTIIKESNSHSFQLISSSKDELNLWYQIIRESSSNNAIEKAKQKGKTEKKILKDIILTLFNQANKHKIINKLNVYQKFFLEKIIQNAAKTLLGFKNSNLDQTASTISKDQIDQVGMKVINSPKENINKMQNQYSLENILTNMNSVMAHSTTKFQSKKKVINEAFVRKPKAKPK